MTDLETLKKEVFDYLRKGLPLMALERIQKSAPEGIRDVAEKLLQEPVAVKELDGEWRDILTLIYFTHFSLITSDLMSREGLASWSVASLNSAKLARKFGLKELEAITLSNSAKALSMMNMADRAERAYAEADRIFRELEMTDEILRGFVSNLNDFGSFCIEHERFDEAEKYLMEAHDLVNKNRELFSDDMLAHILSNLGSLKTEQKKFDEAMEFYSKAEEIFRKVVEKDKSKEIDLAIVLSNFGAMYREMKDFSKAEEKFNEAKEIFEELAKRNLFYRSYLGDALTNLGIIYKKTGRLKEAEEAFLKDLEIKKDLMERNPAYLKSYAHSLDNIADFYKEVGNEKKARKYKEEANRIYEGLMRKEKGSAS
ncbi:hypothetical protein Asulf_01637 [Archaeoglobus sulfaticallidus PM70-1]|uniref:Uncharacterized protein n=1 Tax=Archaeoglobus sulfaticallidus PM70-1 TaxID=387631 RepID=N0BH47_9EURY|nr:tetratricopeptide repeat protein [Archaeoglobus sulfaticallidus]AGK61612.1 hypothetical protein Asulf_01637 [Archaeoglobus sulfaticallidus PM70-1]